MPYVNIKITREGNVTPAQKHALIEGATNLLHDVLGKNKATTVGRYRRSRHRQLGYRRRTRYRDPQAP